MLNQSQFTNRPSAHKVCHSDSLHSALDPTPELQSSTSSPTPSPLLPTSILTSPPPKVINPKSSHVPHFLARAKPLSPFHLSLAPSRGLKINHPGAIVERSPAPPYSTHSEYRSAILSGFKMESILARALEYTLGYWLKSFTRDQFKLQGRTVQLSNLDINGEALHASLGLPPALNVTTAKVGKVQITLPAMSYVQLEPIVVQIDRLDLVLEENDDPDAHRSTSSSQASASPAKSNGYGFAEKIADGMTIEVGTVNLLLETHGRKGGATWASPMASITMRNLLLYTTNESWQVVNLKEARDFSADKKFIYLFKKLEWEYLSIDLLPHPDMFADAHFASPQEGSSRKDDDGAKRSFFGGERFVEGISGEAYITIQRTELNCALGLEVQLHITEAVCPALSEPGLRALLRFLTGFNACLNRGDVHTNVQQHSAEAAGRSLVSLVVDHIFLCIKDAEFQLELLMQSLSFSRTSVSDGEHAKYLTQVMLGGLFLRDTFSRPSCTLVQPLMQNTADDSLHIPDFAKNFCPPIYPLGAHPWQLNEGVPLINLCSLQFKPSPSPPSFASQTVIECQPLMIYLQEESCLRICSFVADGIVINPGAISPDPSVNSLTLSVKKLDVTVPLKMESQYHHTDDENNTFQTSFSGARLLIEALFFLESPSLKLGLLNLEKDPACFCLWEGQPVDSSQKKWTAGASLLSLSLESCNNSVGVQCSGSSNLWRCVELKGASVEVAMATADGSPLIDIPPPGGILRIGVACPHYLSNTSIEQMFFVLDLYAYFGSVSEKMALVGKSNQQKVRRNESFDGNLFDKSPGDTAVSLVVKDLHIRFLESFSSDTVGMPLVQFVGENLSVRVGHRTLGGAIAISTNICWETVEVECADIEKNMAYENGIVLPSVENGHMNGNGYSQLRAVFWVQNKNNNQSKTVPFLEVKMVHVIPYNAEDMECHSLNVSACIAGVRLGGGMNFTEALLHKFGILGPDGGPGEGLSRGLEHLSAGPLSKLFKASPPIGNELQDDGSPGIKKESTMLHLGSPDDVDVSIEFKNWLFALEGAEEMAEKWWFSDSKDSSRAQRCWHTTFRSLQVKAKSSQRHLLNSREIPYGRKKHPIEYITIIAEGIKTLKPQPWKHIQQNGEPAKGFKQTSEAYGGINFEFDMVICEDDVNDAMAKWVIENVKFSVKQPFEAVVTKDELQNLTLLCKSEVDSMGRITVGILRVLKLEGSVGQAAITQLNNLGSEGIANIFGPYNSNSGSTRGSAVLSPSFKVVGGSWNPELESTVASLKAAVLDSQATCAVLTAEMGNPGTSVEHLDHIKQLSYKLESMEKLLAQLRP